MEGCFRPEPEVPFNPDLWEYVVLLPQCFNNGTPVPLSLRQHLEDLAYEWFHGLTVTRGLDGGWMAADGRRDERNDAYRIATSNEPALLAWALYAGRHLNQDSVYVCSPGGRVRLLPTACEPAHAPSRCAQVVRYAVAPEAVANLLRLPSRRGRSGEWICRFAHFEEEICFVHIILNAEPLPSDLIHTPAGTAVVGLTGTRAEILAANERQLARVEAFLSSKLAAFAWAGKEQRR